MIPAAMQTTGSAVAIMPIALPAMMLVAWPVTDCLAIRCTGQYRVSVKNSVMATIRIVIAIPTTPAQKRLEGWGTEATGLRKPLPTKVWVTMKNPTSAMAAATSRPT